MALFFCFFLMNASGCLNRIGMGKLKAESINLCTLMLKTICYVLLDKYLHVNHSLCKTKIHHNYMKAKSNLLLTLQFETILF